MDIPNDPTHSIQDILIIGASISGINAAYRFQTEFPRLRYSILERRSAVGGTWDLFRYPGVRSDSDLHTFAFQWRPWLNDYAFASGNALREYLADAARDTGIDKHILFRHEITRASWSSDQQTWTLSCTIDGTTETKFHARFVFWGSGYYNYNEPLVSTVPGLDDFKGITVHPQFWPADIDYTDKNIAIIGSGATAVTLLPALCQQAKKVTMVQRTPGYILPSSSMDTLAMFLRRWLPVRFVSFTMRSMGFIMFTVLDAFFRRNPLSARAMLKKRIIPQLPPDFPFDPHFVPPYNPLEQRLCVSPDGGFYQAIREGKADIVTGDIDGCSSTSLRLKSGQTVDDIDIIVTATGLKLQFAGGARFFVDGEEIIPGDKFLWRGVMLQDIPNTAIGVGYANASWTLGADTSAMLFARIISRMRRQGFSSVVPRLEAKYAGTQSSPMLNNKSTYVRLNGHKLPKSGDRGPWQARSDHLRELWKLMFNSDTDGLAFTKASH